LGTSGHEEPGQERSAKELRMGEGERFLYLNGEIVEESKARLSPFDRGFLWGDGVYEVTPCFHGKAFRLTDHLDRLYRSLRYVQIEPPFPLAEMEEASEAVLRANASLLESAPVCKLGHWITRGRDKLGTIDPGPGPTVSIICWPVGSYDVTVDDYRKGVRLVVVPTRRNPPESIDPRAKVISKMNQTLAELEAKALGALSLMLDIRGNVAESSMANFFIVRDGAIWTPPARYILEGVTRKVVLELAEQLHIPLVERDFTMYDVGQAEEYFMTQSSTCVVPVRQVDRYTPTEPVPGSVTTRLMKAFVEITGFDYSNL
jgi:branched-chain amino acid aminotransferase